MGCQHRGPAIGVIELWKSWLALGAQYHDGSTHTAATSLEPANSDSPRTRDGVGGRELGMERKRERRRMGVGSRSLDATAGTEVEMVSGSLGSGSSDPRPRFSVD
jgi:hypothetical protein